MPKIFCDVVCGTAEEHQSMTLRAPAGFLLGTAVFASYGLPSGSCGAFVVNPVCHSNISVSVVNRICAAKPSCTLTANNTYFTDPCSKNVKRLYVQIGLNVPTAG